MKGRDLYKAIGSVSEQHVEDTFAYFRTRKKMRFIKIGSVAAALCFVVTGTVLVALHKNTVCIEPGGLSVLVDENGFLIRDGELLKYTGAETDVVIPETVDTIADNAFADTKDLSTVTLTANVKHVGYDAFNGEKGFRLLLSADNRYFTDTGDSIISTDGTNLLQYIGGERESYIIPYGVKQISAFAFYEAKIDEITFPRGLEYIGKGAFAGCSMQAIHLPDSVEYVGVQAFSQCIYAVDGTVPQTAEIGEDAFFRVPFYTSMLAGHPCPGEDIQRGTIKPSEAFVKSAHLQEINDAVLEFIQTGYMRNYDVDRSEAGIRFPDFKQKIDFKSAAFVDGAWGDLIECRAKIYVTDQQYVSIGLACENPYDCSSWSDAEWKICRAEFYPDTYEVQKDDIALVFFRDSKTLNYVLQEIRYNGSKYNTEIDRAAYSPEICKRGLQKVTDGLYVLAWDTYENTFNWKRSYESNSHTLTVIDLRSGELKLTHYLDEIEGYSFKIFPMEGMQVDGQYRLMLTDYNYLFIDWIKYLAGEGGVTLYEFETITIDDVADMGKLQVRGSREYMSYEREINMLCAFITKNTTALEEYSDVPAGTYDLYKTLEFGEYTITQILSGSDLYYQGNINVFLDVEIVKSDIPEIPVGKHCFVVGSGPGGDYVMDKDRNTHFISVHADLKDLYIFVSLLGSRMIPDVNALTEETLRPYREAAIVYIIDHKSTDMSIKIEDVIAYARELFDLTVTEKDIRSINMFSYYMEGDRIYAGGHGGNVVGMDIIEQIEWGDTVTVTVRFYAEGSYTIPAKDIKYTLTRTPDGLAFLTPSEVIQDYGRPIWSYAV